MKLGFAFRDNFEKSLYRMLSPQLVLFPSSYKYYLTKNDRNDYWNSRQIRAIFTEIINKRKQDKDFLEGKDEGGGILSILLRDELFKDDMTIILDECLAFFFAATQTLSI